MLEGNRDSTTSLPDAVWHALTGSHRGFALVRGGARKYPLDMAPFAAVEQQTAAAMGDLHTLMEPGETAYLLGPEPPAVPGLQQGPVLGGLQMLFPAESTPPAPEPGVAIEALDCRHAEEMLELIAVAYPGFFRRRTCEMGRYFGIRERGGQLVAMGGERLVVGQFREISGLCTRPGFTGRGFGSALLRRILAEQRAAGAQSWLQVKASNTGAIHLYQGLGFVITQSIQMQCLTRRG